MWTLMLTLTGRAVNKGGGQPCGCAWSFVRDFQLPLRVHGSE